MNRDIFLKRFEEALQAAITNATDLTPQQRHGSEQSIPKCIAALTEVLKSVPGTTDLTVQHLDECDNAITAAGNLGRRHPQGITGMATQYAHKVILQMRPVVSVNFSGVVSLGTTSTNHTALMAIFQETKRIFEVNQYVTASGASVNLDPNNTRTMAAGTHAYRSEVDGSLKQLDVSPGVEVRVPKPSVRATALVATTAQVMPTDSFLAAKTLIDQGLNPLVLNMANNTSVGGGVENGSAAQEEDLFRCSNYHLALYPHGRQSTRDGRWHYKHDIEEFGSIYTPGVTVIRDREANGQSYVLRNEPFTVSCIAVAGYDLGKADFRRELAGTQLLQKMDAGTLLLDAFEELTATKIKHILEMAILKGHDSVVLGALSCGAFRYRDPVTGQQENEGITAKRVAKACERVLMLPEYKNRFKNITFAILPLGTSGQQNVRVFTDMVQRVLSVRSVSQMTQVSTPPMPVLSQAYSEERKIRGESVAEREARELREAILLQEARELDEVLALSEQSYSEVLALSGQAQNLRIAPREVVRDREESEEEREARELREAIALSRQPQSAVVVHTHQSSSSSVIQEDPQMRARREADEKARAERAVIAREQTVRQPLTEQRAAQRAANLAAAAKYDAKRLGH